MANAWNGKSNLLKGSHWFCTVTLAEVKRKPLSSLVEMKDCAGLSGISGPRRDDAGGPQPTPVGTCMPDQIVPLSMSTCRSLMAQVWLSRLGQTACQGAMQ